MFGVSIADHILAVVLIAVFAFITLFLDTVLRGYKKSNIIAGTLGIVGLLIGGAVFLVANTATLGLLIYDTATRYIVVFVVSLVVLLMLSVVVYAGKCKCGFPMFSLLMFSSLGIMIIAMANDLIVLYLAWELMSIPSYALVAMNYKVKSGAEAAFKYFIYGAISSALILYGISLIFGSAGTLSIAELAQTNLNGNYLSIWGEIFVLLGIGIKVGLVPLHMWIPDTYDGAPTLISGYLSAVTKVGAFVAFYKVFVVAMASLRIPALWFVLVFSAITMTFGNIFALGQKNVVRMLAYSSIAHAGYIVSIFAVVATQSLQLLIFYLTVFSFADIGVFISVWAFREYFGVVTIDDYNSIANSAKLLAFMTMIFLLSLTGIPPLSGFAGKLIIFLGLLNSGYLWLAILIAINSAISLGYYGRLIKRMYLDEPKGEVVRGTVPKLVYVPIVITTIITFGLGLYPQIIFSLL